MSSPAFLFGDMMQLDCVWNSFIFHGLLGKTLMRRVVRFGD